MDLNDVKTPNNSLAYANPSHRVISMADHHGGAYSTFLLAIAGQSLFFVYGAFVAVNV